MLQVTATVRKSFQLPTSPWSNILVLMWGLWGCLACGRRQDSHPLRRGRWLGPHGQWRQRAWAWRQELSPVCSKLPGCSRWGSSCFIQIVFASTGSCTFGFIFAAWWCCNCSGVLLRRFDQGFSRETTCRRMNCGAPQLWSAPRLPRAVQGFH